MLDAAAELDPNVLAFRADGGKCRQAEVGRRSIAWISGGLDGLFAKAGIGEFRPPDQWDWGGVDRSFAVSLKGPFF